MSKINGNIDFESLAVKYLAGSASSEEVDRLESWVKSDREKQRLFSEIKISWRIAETAGQTYDKAKAWENITANSSMEFSDDKIKPLLNLTSISRNKMWRTAAAILLLIIGSYSLYQFFPFRDRSVIATNETMEIILHDGSSVSLNTHSSLSYARRFSGNERRVKLEGEGYFEVATNPKRPFIVEVDGLEVRVLGTSFYINAQKDAPKIEVVVKTGKVSMVTTDNRQLELSGGQRGVFIKNDDVLLENIIENPNYLSWKTRFFVFENTGLKEVFDVLGHVYGVSFSIDDKDLENYLLTATFKERPLEDVLEILKETFGLRFQLSNGIIRVSEEV